MSHAYFRFFGPLNDFLPKHQRQRVISVALNGVTAVKHTIESLGVPHPEIELILANQQPVDFSYLVQSGDHVDVHGVIPVNGKPQRGMLRAPLAPPLRFVLDTHLGQLATYLRLLGFDALYRNDYDDAELAQISQVEQRVLLTRDRGLLKRKNVIYGYCVRASDPRRQIIDVLRRYQLAGEIRAWRRCLRCNGVLAPADKAQIWERLAPKTRLHYDEFHRCQSCGQIYWQGSHYAAMQKFVESVVQEIGR
jgi:uncharacterized protein with PIN domain